MEFVKEGWAQAGAVGALLAFAGIVIWRLYVEWKAERARNESFGERVLTIAVESRKAIEANTDAQRGLIDRFDRAARS